MLVKQRMLSAQQEAGLSFVRFHFSQLTAMPALQEGNRDRAARQVLSRHVTEGAQTLRIFGTDVASLVAMTNH